jgi:predicted  nucleic acid-binding Zn-ribbon protein
MHFSDLQSIREVSARISHLEQVLKEKSTDLGKTEDLDEKEALRHEIQNLRRTKECLSKERCDLDEKLQKVNQGCKEKNIIYIYIYIYTV